MKRQIVFMVINMNIGGTEKALLNMIAEMPKNKYDITILMLEKNGGFLRAVPNHVHIKYVEGYGAIKDQLHKPIRMRLVHLLRKGKLLDNLGLLFVDLTSRVVKNKAVFLNYILKDIPNLKSEYDTAIAYAGPMDFISYFVIHKINAKRKVQWIHFDIDKIGFDHRFAARMYTKFDQLFVVSDAGKKKILNQFPSVQNKTEVFPNLVSPSIIQKEAIKGTGFQDNFKGIRILTVGRLSFEKGQDLAIRVLSRLLNEGYNVRWYCVGEGIARKDYESKINELNLNGRFILLGADPNPYSYMEACDMYVQPSRHEGFCITLAEAKAFSKPIITTNFTGSTEQIINGKTGSIVKFNEMELYGAMKELLDNPQQSKEFSDNLSKETRNDACKTKMLDRLI